MINDKYITHPEDKSAAAKSLQSCPTLCDPRDGSPRGHPIPGILQARTLEWVAISFSNAWKWKVKVRSLSCVWLFVTPWTAAYQAPPHGIFQASVLDWGAIAFSEPSTTSAEFQNFNWLHNNFPTPNQPCDTIYWLPLSPLWRMLTHLKVFRNLHDEECKTMCHLKNLIC